MDFDHHVEELMAGRLHRFSDWLDTPIERGPTGVYTIWNADMFVYAGMSWKESSKGLWGRMNSHASGRRSGDQFCVYISDRFVLPTLNTDDMQGIANGVLRLDELTRDYIHTHLSYRYVLTETGSEARTLESHIRTEGLPGVGQPFLNPS